MTSLRETSAVIDKGKGRELSTDLSERTPLLASQSHTSREHADLEVIARSRQRLWSKLTFIFLFTLSICMSNRYICSYRTHEHLPGIITFIVVAVLAYSYAVRASRASPGDLLDRAVIVKGPYSVDVLNITKDDGIWVNVESMVGVDAWSVIGVNSEKTDGIFSDVWKSLGRWGIRKLGGITVKATTVRISPENEYSTVLASLDISPVTIPLTTEPSPDLSWLTKVNLLIHIVPIQNLTTLARFAHDSWLDGLAVFHAHVERATVHGGSLHEISWRRSFKQQINNIHRTIRINSKFQTHLTIRSLMRSAFAVPPLPGFPSPGRNMPFPPISELITLQTFSISSEPRALLLRAHATVIDPIPPSIDFTSPALPFIISLPSEVNISTQPIPLASVQAQPFSLTHPNITINIFGNVLPVPSSSTPILSSFLTSYLSGKAAPILISCPIFPSYVVETLFPAPNPKPKVLRNVTIHHMKVIPKGTTFSASGTIYARVVLPQGVKISLDVNRILPDVLVFDGEVPLQYRDDEDDEGNIPPAPPLPDPLPEHAFARIRPDDWLVSSSEPGKAEGDEGSVYIVTADIVDVPLQVLPGRQKDFSNFVSKVCARSH